ncbi:MAG: lipopolysaccharide heptosyltransferase II [Thermoguttaceae bacterium]|jgi:heptosyltransferase-2
MKAVIFLPNWLGDLVMATPLLRAVRRKFGNNARLVGVLRPYLADVLSGTDWLDEQWFFNPRAADRSERAWAVTNRLRQEHFDLAILMTNSVRPALMSWWAGIKQRLGYAQYGRGPLLTYKLHPRRQGGQIVQEPVVETYLTIADALGCGRESARLELATTTREEDSADAVFKRLDLRRDGRLILLNSGSAYGAARVWPVEYFGSLARRLTKQYDHDVLVMCGPNEQGIAKEVVKHSDSPRVFSMADQPLDLGTAKACIRRGRLMVSTDSGPRHVAAALGKPVITLYGPTPPLWSENPTQRAINLSLDLDCIACKKRVCPLKHHRCMRELTVDMVFAAVLKMLESCPSIPQPHFVSSSKDLQYAVGPSGPRFPTLVDERNLLNSGQGNIASI